MEIVGIVIAVIAALFVLIHARVRQLPIGSAVAWAVATFLFLIIALPIYLLIHGPEPKAEEDESWRRFGPSESPDARWSDRPGEPIARIEREIPN